MGILLINDEVKAAIGAMIERARARPVTWEQMKGGALFNHEGPTVQLKDRKPAYARPPSENIIIGTYRIAFSIEEQPGPGLCRHLSVSTPKPGTIPNSPVVHELLELFGFNRDWDVQMWREEFDPGHFALNLIQPLNPGPPPAGHA